MARDKCNPIELYQALINRLVDQLEIDPADCLFAIDPHVERQAVGDYTFVLSPLSGQFSDGMIDGGGLQQITASGGVSVTIRAHLQQDEAKENREALLGPDLGLIAAATRVIRAFTVFDPEDSDGNELLRDLMAPTGYEFGIGGRKQNRSPWMTLGFSTNFDWDTSQ